MEIPPALLILLPLAFAAGLDLYLTLLTVGMAISLGLGLGVGVGALGGAAISPLQGVLILLGLAGLFLAEAAMESRPVGALLWHNLQLLFRPFGASLLGLFLLQGEASGFMVLGAAMAGVVAAFSHVLYWGQGFLLRIVPDQRLSPLAFTFAGDLATMALLALTLISPNLGVLLATLLLLPGLILGRTLHGAVRFGLTLFLERVWGIVSPTVWQTDAELPAWIRKWTAPGSLDGPRGAPAATWGVVGPGRFRDGWILQKNQEIFFVYRKARAIRFVRMDGIEEMVDVGPLSKTIRYRSPDRGSSALFLQLGLIGPESHK
ncbi:MAG: DUF4126 family protein [Gemmatimonadota bacterium]